MAVGGGKGEGADRDRDEAGDMRVAVGQWLSGGVVGGRDGGGCDVGGGRDGGGRPTQRNATYLVREWRMLKWRCSSSGPAKPQSWSSPPLPKALPVVSSRWLLLPAVVLAMLAVLAVLLLLLSGDASIS